MTRGFAIGCLLWLGALSLGATTPAELFDTNAAAKADPQFDLSTFRKLTLIEVNVEWNNADIEDALAQLTSKSAGTDRAKRGIKFRLVIPQKDKGAHFLREVSMSLTNVPIMDLLFYMSEQTKLTPLIHKNEVVMVPEPETRYKPDPSDPKGGWER